MRGAGTMLEQLGLIGTIRDEEQSPEEPDTESDQEVSQAGHTAQPLPGATTPPGRWRRTRGRLENG